VHAAAGHARRCRAAAGACRAGTGRREAHHGYLFANARATRIKLLVHDGLGVWCAARRLNVGRFVWPREAGSTQRLALTQAQFDALVLGLPWQRLHEMSVIARV
jgi:transposase